RALFYVLEAISRFEGHMSKAAQPPKLILRGRPVRLSLTALRAAKPLEAYRRKSSRRTDASVFSSLYFTIMGVYKESPRSAPLPLVIALEPGTTTAPSGISSGDSSVLR